MEAIGTAWLFYAISAALAVGLALASRAAMKRLVASRLGRAEDALLEIDFWRATKGDALRRPILFIELLSWAATIGLVAILASRALA